MGRIYPGHPEEEGIELLPTAMQVLTRGIWEDDGLLREMARDDPETLDSC